MNDALVTSEIGAREGQPPYPVVILLHGRGADEQDLLPLVGDLDPRWRYVSARAPLSAGFGGYRWYDSERIGKPDAATFADSLRLGRDLVVRLAAEAPVLAICGFSQGAVMALALMAQNPQVAAAAALSGFLAGDALASDIESLRDRPVFVGHGQFDPVIPVSFGQQARERLEEAGVRVTYREYPMAHAVSEREVSDLKAWLGERLG